MARPRTIDDEQLLSAARAVFLERGREAPTSAIAALAGVSEGTLFKRFGTKETLFFRAMALPTPARVVALANEPLAVGDEQARFVALGEALIGFFRELLPRMMRCWTHPQFSPQRVMREHAEPPPAQIIGAVTRLVERCIESGALRETNPEVVARAMVSAMHNFAFLEWMEIASLPGRVGSDAGAYVRSHVDLIWHGAAREVRR